MYLRYFGFESYPFAVTPDPAFLYLSESHREALAHLLYGAGEHGGFVSLIGEVGTGKTTLIRSVVDSELPDLDIALCWNPQLGVREFVATICDELGVKSGSESGKASLKSLTDRLNTHLLAAHAENRRTVLIVDEAQNLSRDVLEQLRLLTNLETHKHKLLRIILVGQPELAGLLARHDLRQLAQRITARFVLKPLGYAETRAYVQHRLACANGPQHLFTQSATTVLRTVTGGVPRLINVVCERALMGAYAHGRAQIGAWTILRAATESLPRRAASPLRGWWGIALPTGALAAVLGVAGLAWLPDIPSTNAAENHGVEHRPGDHRATAAKTDQQDHKTSAKPRSSSANAKDQNKTEAPPPVEPKPASADKPSDVSAAKTHHAAAKPEPGADAANHDTPDARRQPAGPPRSRSGGDQAASAAAKDIFPQGDADMNQLLRLWGVFGAEVHTRCDDLKVGDLRCLADTGTLKTLRLYNRPALIEIKNGDQNQTVLLSALAKNQATLVGGNGTRDVSLAGLRARWDGRFRVIWRARTSVRLIRPGSVGSAVVWLRQQLDQIDGKNPATQIGKPSPVYDDALGKRLEQFQRTHGLDADGLAGPRTQMMLNGALPSPGTPSLAPAAAKDK